MLDNSCPHADCPTVYLPKMVSANSISAASLYLLANLNSPIEPVSYALGRATITRPLTRTVKFLRNKFKQKIQWAELSSPQSRWKLEPLGRDYGGKTRRVIITRKAL